MSFLVWAALAVAALVVAPVVAHLLRRSRAEESEFPPARLVPVMEAAARQRSRIEDRALLSIRALMIVGLALLGATPLVQCSRLSIARQSGGSVALAIVVDDSLSMQVKTAAGPTRFELAQKGALQLLGTAREGDAVALILAGAPARLALSSTTDLAAARRALDQLHVTDRGTDLESAVQLARSALKQLPHTDRRVVLLSDFAGFSVPDGEPAVWAPLGELRAAADDCGIVSAEAHGRRVSLNVACSSTRAARGRSLEVTVGSGKRETPGDAGAPQEKARAGDVVGSAKLEAKAGEQVLSVDVGTASFDLDARLTGQDAVARDDQAPIAGEPESSELGVLSDPATSAAVTGGSVLEQALDALSPDMALRPLSVLPDDEKGLSGFAAVLLDDPAGLSPEARATLTSWIERGGVAVAWLGPRSESVQLGTTLEPFARGALAWEPTRAKGVDPASIAWLGAAAQSLSDIHPKGRVRLEGALPPAAHVLARWDDGQPWIAELALGRGLVLAVGLPVSIDQSDVALRPGFLALLDHVAEQASRRSGPRRTVAGLPWVFPAAGPLQVSGPTGELRVEEPAGPDAQRSVVPELVGRYHVSLEGYTEHRIVTLDPREITTPPREPEARSNRVLTGGVQSRLDASSQVALALLALLSLELCLRAIGRFRPRTRRRKLDRASAP